MKKRISFLGRIIVYARRILVIIGEHEIKKQTGEVPLHEK